MAQKNAHPIRRTIRVILCAKTWCVGGYDLRNGGTCPDCNGTGLGN